MKGNYSWLHGGFFWPIADFDEEQPYVFLSHLKKYYTTCDTVASTVQHCAPYAWILSCQAPQKSPEGLRLYMGQEI